MGKAIYKPKGKAAEYSQWACNFYVGCSNNCSYCYCKKGVLANVMGGMSPELKKCFKNDDHAFEIFLKELNDNLSDVKQHGIFFSFSTDPMLPETFDLTMDAAMNAVMLDVPVMILTKRADWIDEFLEDYKRLEFNLHYSIYPDKPFVSKKHLWSFGFTLTGHDDLEPGATSNYERIKGMLKLHKRGYRTWASIEPIIDFEESELMISKTKGFCKHYKIGLKSGSSPKPEVIIKFMNNINFHVSFSGQSEIPTIYWKDSLLKRAGLTREDLPSNCVNADYKFWKKNDGNKKRGSEQDGGG